MVAEMVKPAEKIGWVKNYRVSGMSGSHGHGQTAQVSPGEKPVVNLALDSIKGMTVQMPALKKLGEEPSLSMEDGISAVTSSALGAGEAKPAANGSVVNGLVTEAEPGASA